MKMKKQFRQGDVLIESIEKKPKGKKINKTNKFLLVRGEGRNHGHFIIGDIDVLESSNDDCEFELSVRGASELKHLLIDSGVKAEHETIEIPNFKFSTFI